MGVAISLDILGIDAVTGAVAKVVGLVVTNHALVGGSGTLAAGLWADDFAFTKALLAGSKLVGADAMVGICAAPSTYIVSM